MQSIWILINCNSQEEAEKIGDRLLHELIINCYNIFDRKLSKYFWPPKSHQLEAAKGALLIAETFEPYYEQVRTLVKSLHSDKLAFIGYIPIYGLEKDFVDWMRGELKK